MKLFCILIYNIDIREEIKQIENGTADRDQNVLKSSPHTLKQICSDDWNRPYSRKLAAYPIVLKIFKHILYLYYLYLRGIRMYVYF